MKKTIVLVLKESKDFSFRDVLLIKTQILLKWKNKNIPKIICLWDRASQEYDLGGLLILPITNTLPGTWSRMQLYSPEMEKYRPFLYIDLDTAIIESVENIFDLVMDHQSKFITLEDFYQKNALATGVVWFPSNSEKIRKVWKGFKVVTGRRMDYFLRKVITADIYWQKLTNLIVSFKPNKKILAEVPKNTLMVCFHGKPRIFDARVPWVEEYVKEGEMVSNKKVTVIIPYRENRGWLDEAISSVSKNVQLILAKGEANWPTNFNIALEKAEGDYIKFLHEDDMLTEECIEESIKTFEDTGADFIHGNAIELTQNTKVRKTWKPVILIPTFETLFKKNTIHCVTLMYKKEVFEKLGKLDESLETAEEYEFNLRCLKNGMKIGYSSKELGVYRRHPLQKVRITPKKEKNEEREMVKKRHL